MSFDALRASMASQNVDSLVLRSVDPHGSEYVSPMFKYLGAVSGFGGSAGTILVTATQVLLFCDPRYWEEAANTVVKGLCWLFRFTPPA